MDTYYEIFDSNGKFIGFCDYESEAEEITPEGGRYELVFAKSYTIFG